MTSLLQAYHRLPVPARSMAASLRGYYLRAWRYCRETDRLVEEVLEREHWSSEQWKTWQEERLAYVLHRAAMQVPYYRQQWSKRHQAGDRASCEYLENWPILDKEEIRVAPLTFLADDCRAGRMYHEHTSGTTGKPIQIWASRKTICMRYALFEARWRRWNDVSRHDRWAILGGQLVTPVARKEPPFWVWNQALNQLYMSSYHLSANAIPAYIDAMSRYKVVYIWGYTSAVYEIAQHIIHQQLPIPSIKVVLTNAEPLLDYQRITISQAFQCPVRETYGMTEFVAMASECSEGNLHLSPEVGVTEVVSGEQKNDYGEMGDFLHTGLVNEDMPLIRYRLGDRGALAPPETSCRCTRVLPQLASIEGRSDDVLYTVDGRRIGRLDPVFKADLPILEAQIIQETLQSIKILVVPADGFDDDCKSKLGENLRARLGPVSILFEEIDRIPRTSNGKFRAVICNIAAKERKTLA